MILKFSQQCIRDSWILGVFLVNSFLRLLQKGNATYPEPVVFIVA